MSTQKIEDAKSLFAAFAAEMNAWEVKWYGLIGAEQFGLERHREEIKSELVVIYDRFLTRKERKTGRLAGPDVGYPPEYDPANEEIVTVDDIGAGKVSIQTNWVHPTMKDYTEKRRYILVFKNEDCRIDKKEVFSSVKDKWVAQTF